MTETEDILGVRSMLHENRPWICSSMLSGARTKSSLLMMRSGFFRNTLRFASLTPPSVTSRVATKTETVMAVQGFRGLILH